MVYTSARRRHETCSVLFLQAHADGETRRTSRARRMSKHFLVADTPEHYTSKTCSACHECCGPFEALETCRRKELKAKATTDHEKKAAYHKIRGLRRCQHAECGVILHRDRNAASNIAENFYRLYEGKPCLGKATAPATALHEAPGKLED